MPKRTCCNCHWSRQVSCMRHCWNKIFFVMIRVMVVINQIVIMSPFICLKNPKKSLISVGVQTTAEFARRGCLAERADGQWKFRTHRLMTAAAIMLFLCYVVASPFMVKMASDLYASTRRNRDDLFITIAQLIMTTDVLCYLLVMANNIWHRVNIVKILNFLNQLIAKFEQLENDFIGLKPFLILLFKITLITGDVVLGLPEFVASSHRYSTQSIVGFLFTHYLYTLGRIFDLTMFIFVLIFLACSWHLEKELQCNNVAHDDLRMLELMSLQDALQKGMSLFRSTFELAIFLIILSYFVTILCNIYATLDLYVSSHHVFGTLISFLLSLIVELYSLICVVYLFDRSQRKVKDLFLQQEELYSLKPPDSLSVVLTDVLWPHLEEFRLLGLFTLNHKFVLFLFTYSINFILFILEFEIYKASL